MRHHRSCEAEEAAAAARSYPKQIRHQLERVFIDKYDLGLEPSGLTEVTLSVTFRCKGLRILSVSS